MHPHQFELQISLPIRLFMIGMFENIKQKSHLNKKDNILKRDFPLSLKQFVLFCVP